MFGHSRLAIIDLEGGKQPMLDTEAGFMLSYNGELYNYRELRLELIAKGHQFHSESDTEVLLKAWIEWGEEAVHKFNGFFAFSIYDKREKKIFLVRDRLGLKPLYYHLNEDALIFASSIPALCELSTIDKAIDEAVMSHYLATRHCTLGKRTLFKSISILEPGQILSMNLNNSEIHIKSYWEIPVHAADSKSDMSFTDAVEATRELLDRSIRDRLISDVPVGAFLSGGIDSSIICSRALEFHNTPLPLYCANLDNSDYDESNYARMMANALGQDLHISTMTQELFFKDWDFLIEQKGLPLSTPNEMSIYQLSKALKETSTVALTGEGADEIFGGYILPLFGVYDFQRAGRSNNNELQNMELNYSMQMEFGRSWFANELDHYFSTGLWFNFADKMALYKDEFWESLNHDSEMIVFYEDYMESVAELSSFDKRMHQFTKFNLENLLLRVDSSSMAASVEARVPFTDHRLVEMAFSLPDHFKIDWRSKEAEKEADCLTVNFIDQKDLLESKRLIRHAYKHEIPGDIIDRKKMSFPVPFREWLQKSQSSQYESVKESALFKKYFNESAIEQLFQTNSHKLWLIHNLVKWHDSLS